MTTVLSLNLSSNAIMQEIYAVSALRCVLNGVGNHRSPLLTRDRSAALRIVVKDAFAHVIMKMMPYVEASNLNGETAKDADVDPADSGEEMLLQADVRLCGSFQDELSGTLRHYVEHAVAMYALHLCYMGHDAGLSVHHERLAEKAIASIAEMARAGKRPDKGVVPHWL